MGIRPPQFDEVAAQLAPCLEGLPGHLVAIDGRMAAGKSTLGRFLAWYFNVALVETDLFLVGDGTLRRRVHEINRVVASRLDREHPRPVILEGVALLELLEQLGRTANALVYVENIENPVAPSEVVLEYERRFRPAQKAAYIVRLSHEG